MEQQRMTHDIRKIGVHREGSHDLHSFLLMCRSDHAPYGGSQLGNAVAEQAALDEKLIDVRALSRDSGSHFIGEGSGKLKLEHVGDHN